MSAKHYRLREYGPHLSEDLEVLFCLCYIRRPIVVASERVAHDLRQARDANTITEKAITGEVRAVWSARWVDWDLASIACRDK
jgi:hypothetical protein